MLTHLPLSAISHTDALRAHIAQWKSEGLRVGFVPTMGALHAGHISLIETALRHADRVVASVFVNPTQFAPGEDFDSYPRTLEADAQKLVEAGCHLLYAPLASDMYPEGFATKVSLDGPALELETDFRPHFFAGVATVVSKLFQRVRPDVAVFGQKDFQQLRVIERMTLDLDLDIEIIGAPTLREDDGLAMSSRNAYLSAQERQTAAQLFAILSELKDRLEAGKPLSECLFQAREKAQSVFDSVDYIAVRDDASLSAIETHGARPARVLAAVKLGKTRLIDNLPVHGLDQS